ncbi:MAG: hypothetical protein ABR968_05165 [Bacteroidales bacterium]|jgi:hypothetical protein
MKKLIFILLLFAVSYSYGQVRVALQHQGTTTLFSGTQPLQDAYTAAVSGDTLYLPGTTFSGLTITKQLVIYGTGHYPDSTTATGVSVINGFSFDAGSDNSVLEGVKIAGNLNNNSYEVKVDSVTISRCHITGSIQLYSSYFDNTHPKCVNWKIKQSVVDGNIDCTDASTIQISNNIIAGYINDIFESGLIANNVLLYFNNWLFTGVNSSLIQNNIILDNDIINVCQFNLIQKNIFVYTPAMGTNTALNNFYPVTQSSIFVSQSGNSFDYSQDYHLASPSTYVGTDGHDIGIYGGMYPYKEGAVPFNPHIISKSIPQNTDVNGHLNINIKVDAQNN